VISDTILHLEPTLAKKAEHTSEDANIADQRKVITTSVNHASFDQHKQVLFATAIVKTMDKRGRCLVEHC